MTKFGKTLTKEFQRAGLTQAAGAAVLGVEPRTLYNWIHTNPPLEITQEGALARLDQLPDAHPTPR